MKSILSMLITIAFAAAFSFGNPDLEGPSSNVTPGEHYIFEFQTPQPENQKHWDKHLKNQRFRITTDGYINFPFVGNLKIGGLSFKEAEKALEEALKKQNIAINLLIMLSPPK